MIAFRFGEIWQVKKEAAGDSPIHGSSISLRLQFVSSNCLQGPANFCAPTTLVPHSGGGNWNMRPHAIAGQSAQVQTIMLLCVKNRVF